MNEREKEYEQMIAQLRDEIQVRNYGTFGVAVSLLNNVGCGLA